MTEHFGDTPDDFDLDSWIDQATRPRREVTIYRDWALLEDYDRLAAQLAAHDAEGAAADEAMGDEGPEAIRTQMREILERMESSALTFTVQALTQPEVKELAEAAPVREIEMPDGSKRERVDEVALGDAMVAAAVLSPTITADQVRRLRTSLGDGPVSPLIRAVTELRTVGEVLPEVPSSRER